MSGSNQIRELTGDRNGYTGNEFGEFEVNSIIASILMKETYTGTFTDTTFDLSNGILVTVTRTNGYITGITLEITQTMKTTPFFQAVDGSNTFTSDVLDGSILPSTKGSAQFLDQNGLTCDPSVITVNEGNLQTSNYIGTLFVSGLQYKKTISITVTRDTSGKITNFNMTKV